MYRVANRESTFDSAIRQQNNRGARQGRMGKRKDDHVCAGLSNCPTLASRLLAQRKLSQQSAKVC